MTIGADTRRKPNRAAVEEAYGRYVTTLVAPGRSVDHSLALECRIWRDYFGSLLPRDRSARIADIGCGGGSFLYFLRQRGYTNVAGVDRSREQIELAHRRGIEDAVLGDAEGFLAANQESFDCLTSFDVVEHIPREDTLEFLRALFNALRPGGRLILRTPNGAGPLGSRIRYSDFTHEQAFTRASIAQVLRLAGFERIQVLGEGPRVHGIVSAVRWLLWKVIEASLWVYLAVETGQLGEIFTQNLIAVAHKGDSA
jgi:2-polyprenyl-3-methyl-5-hydroxy-6-metoxy-1,4-benzoquinol methylase